MISCYLTDGRTGHHPVRILADKIYRNRENLAYCKTHRIRLSGPALGRPKKNPDEDRKTEYQDAVDRIEVERSFSLAKRCFGLGLITTKLDTTTRSSIVLSIIAMNVDRISALHFLSSIWDQISKVFFKLFPDFDQGFQYLVIYV